MQARVFILFVLVANALVDLLKPFLSLVPDPCDHLYSILYVNFSRGLLLLCIMEKCFIG